MIAVRKKITVPAAGTFVEVGVGGRSVYVEQSPDNTPEGVPTWHLQKGGPDVPLYSRSAFTWLPGFDRFYVKGTALAAGSDLYLLIYEDPCNRGVFDPEQPFNFDDCPEPLTVEPAFFDEPTHSIVVNSGGNRVYVMDSAGAIVRTLATSDSLELNQIYVDYAARRVYYMKEDDANTQVELHRVDIDGTGDVIVKVSSNITPSGNTYNVFYDPARGEIFATGSGLAASRFTLTGAEVAIGNVSDVAAGLLNGVHFARLASSQVDKAEIATPANFVILSSNGANSIAVDPETGYAYLRDATTIRWVDRDNPGVDTTILTGLDNGTSEACNIHNRWLYTADGTAFKRIRLDDHTDVETTDIVLPASVNDAWPWRE